VRGPRVRGGPAMSDRANALLIRALEMAALKGLDVHQVAQELKEARTEVFAERAGNVIRLRLQGATTADLGSFDALLVGRQGGDPAAN